MRTRLRGRADAALRVCALALAAALAACAPAAVADAPAATVNAWVHSGSGSSVEQATTPRRSATSTSRIADG